MLHQIKSLKVRKAARNSINETKSSGNKIKIDSSRWRLIFPRGSPSIRSKTQKAKRPKESIQQKKR